MSLQTILPPPGKRAPIKGFALFNLGFRPFFLGGALFAMLSILIWMHRFFTAKAFTLSTLTPSQWHAHEMLYGYGLSIIAGFLLTAVRNWTNVQTVQGKALACLFGLWFAARVCMMLPESYWNFAAVLDLLFDLGLIVAVAMPIIKARQWRQIAVISKVLLLGLGNGLFYLGMLGILEIGVVVSQTLAMLLILSLILVIGRRVIPFFIERGLGLTHNLVQYKWLDISIMVLFLLWLLDELLLRHGIVSRWACVALFALNGYRMMNWYQHGIWRVPLLWSLYLAIWSINLGFLLYGLRDFLAIGITLPIHVFTIGGIGLITLAMMARVSLGHTGRNIHQPPKWVSMTFVLMVLSMVFRALMPMLDMSFYRYGLIIGTVCWVLGFGIFVLNYAPMLAKPRLDGQAG
ncbi:MAG TPA: NnrS family protein [Methylophilus sp.]|nr:NnrS family protein [Methylophilus sp.]HQQ33572.1 NnrS family protein [Methylophilus sp.]